MPVESMWTSAPIAPIALQTADVSPWTHSHRWNATASHRGSIQTGKSSTNFLSDILFIIVLQALFNKCKAQVSNTKKSIERYFQTSCFLSLLIFPLKKHSQNIILKKCQNLLFLPKLDPNQILNITSYMSNLTHRLYLRPFLLAWNRDIPSPPGKRLIIWSAKTPVHWPWSPSWLHGSNCIPL